MMERVLKWSTLTLAAALFYLFFPKTFVITAMAVAATLMLVSLVATVIVLIASSEKEEVGPNGKKKVTKRPWQATYVPRGNVVLVFAGENLQAVWPNVGGHKMSEEEDLDGRHWLVKIKPTLGLKLEQKERVDQDATPEEKERVKKRNSQIEERNRQIVRKDIDRQSWESFFRKEYMSRVFIWRWVWLQKLWWKWFGIRFVSWFYPKVRVATFEISRLQLKGGLDVKNGASLQDRIVESQEDPTVHSVLFLVPRPILVKGIALAGDNSSVNVLLLAVFHTVVPTTPVVYWKGNWFPFVDAAIEAGVVNACAIHRVAVDENGHLLGNDFDEFHKIEEAKEKEEEKKVLLKPDQDVKDLNSELAERGRTNGFYRAGPLTLRLWRQVDRAAIIEKHLRRLNATQKFYDELKKKSGEDGELFVHLRDNLLEGASPMDEKELEKLPDSQREYLKKQVGLGLIPRFGFVLISVRLVGEVVNTVSNDLDEAIRDVEVNTQKAEAARREAAGVRDTKKMVAAGEAALYGQPVEALTKLGVTPDVAAQVFATATRTSNIGGEKSKVVTYVEGGATVPVMVPVPPSSPPAPPTPPATPPPTPASTPTSP